MTLQEVGRGDFWDNMQRQHCATHRSIMAMKVLLHNKNEGHHKTNWNLKQTNMTS